MDIVIEAPEAVAASATDLRPTRRIGEILAERCQLGREQVERTLELQRERGLRFGEAAVALGHVSMDDVMQALAQQFQYPWVPAPLARFGADLVTLSEPFSPAAEGFRALRSQLGLRLWATEAPRPALAVAGVEPGAGRSYCAANLAVSLAQLGGRTLLVDADLRAPRQHEIFHLDNTSGLSGVLAGHCDWQVVQPVPGVGQLFVLSAGPLPPNPLELVEGPAFVRLLRTLVARFDHVVVDTPAAARAPDAAVIAARCGAAMLVARRHTSGLDALRSLASAISASSVRLAGVVYNER